MKLCFIAHPDDDALWFGNFELSFGFDVKVLLTYSPNDVRAREFLRWSRYCNPQTSIFFLGFNDLQDGNNVSVENFSVESVVEALRRHKVPCDIGQLFTHDERGEYGHAHHRIVSLASSVYFSTQKTFTPSYPAGSHAREIVIGGPKKRYIEEFYPSQARGLIEQYADFCCEDRLLESTRAIHSVGCD